MSTEDISTLAIVAVQAALRAGEILRRGFGTPFEIKSKPGKQNYVTVYDQQAEAAIISVIKQQFPLHNILAEESGLETKGENQILWTIDPLDGTTNFAHQIPIMTVSIAASKGCEKLCGVIYQPFTQELFVAEKGKGAFLNGNRLNVSQTDQMDNALIVAAVPFDDTCVIPGLNFNTMLEISRAGATLRNFGSAALALAYLSAGKIDAMWMYHLYPWDTTAGQLLVEEAGGIVYCYAVDRKDPHSPLHVIAANPALYQALTT